MRILGEYQACSHIWCIEHMRLEASEYPIPQIIVVHAEVEYRFASYQVAISRKEKAK